MKLVFSQQLAQRQSTVITAQLQQAIKLLQMGNAELERYIESQTEENPFIDLIRAASDNSGAGNGPVSPELSRYETPARTGPDMARKNPSMGDEFDLIASVVQMRPVSLYAHVSAAADRMFETAKDRILAEVFLDALEPSGWLDKSVEGIAAIAQVDVADAEAVLDRLQTIEPTGLFAQTLSECLRLQAKDQDLLTPAFETLLKNLPMLAAGDLSSLSRACGCDMDRLREMLRQLRSFNPKPGTMQGADDIFVRPPDLLVRRGDAGEWLVDLNRSTLPTIAVREDQAADFSKAGKEVAEYVSEQISGAKWLRRAVAHRNETTLKVGAEVVRRQAAFLEHGASHIRPMILREVADAIGVHESTVSRVTSGLMMATPQGTFLLKSFFSVALASTGEDGMGSAAAVRHRIRQLVDNEPQNAPLSDDTIMQVISDEGTHLARRTVAKYRGILNIPSSFQRRRNSVVAGML